MLHNFARQYAKGIFTGALLAALVIVTLSAADAGATVSGEARTPVQVAAEPQGPDGGDGALPLYLPVARNRARAVTGTAPAGALYMPYAVNRQLTSYRLGYATVTNNLLSYDEVNSLRAGWYVNWGVQVDPPRPNAMDFVQMIRVHHKLACPLGSGQAADRNACPYEDDYLYWPSAARIEAAARAQPGSLWLIGNEMDRRDFCGDIACSFSVGQDEMLPEMYARAYHDLYHLVKDADPTAQIAIGGLIQATPLRLQYLTTVWNHYVSLYGVTMPVDVWNIHAFVLREERNGFGADTPPGSSAQTGEYTDSDCAHMDREPFDKQIRAMRRWMKERGQQNKPLIVTEYGVLYPHIYQGGPCGDPALDPTSEQAVIDYMLWTFDYFLDTKDESLGYPADDYRLVQRWNWYSLDHLWTDGAGNVLSGFNPYSSLYNSTTRKLTATGKAFRDFSHARQKELSR